MKLRNIKIKSDFFFLNSVLSIVTILSSVFLIYNVFRFSGVSVVLFTIALFILVLLNILDALLDIASKDHRYLKIPSVVFSVVLLLLTLYGNFYLIRIKGAVDNAIIDTTITQTENVTTSFVVFNSTSYSDLVDITNKKVGYVDNDSFQEGNLLPKALLEKEKINVNYIPFASYNDMLLALFNGDINVAPLPEDYYSMFIVNEGYEEYLDQTSTFYSFTEKVKILGTEQSTKNLTTEPFTILLMGNADGLSDTLILATFNPRTMTATMTSIPRDSYVPIACYTDQAKDKITHARVVSRQCTIDTVQNFLDVKVDYFVEVNFSAVVEVVDALGGLWLNSPVEFVGQDSSSDRGNFTVWVGEGWQTMDGQQVLTFARERHAMPGGDNQRQLNQQAVISAMISKLMDTKDIGMFINVIEAAGNNIKTNIPLSAMTNLAQYLISQMSTTSINSNYLLEIKNTRILGYSSWMYHDELELPLYISKPYQEAILDSQKIINENLMIDYVPNNEQSFTFNVEWPYATPNYIKYSYNEKEIHDPLPDFMPSMTSSTKTWLLSDVLTWGVNRPWINLTIKEIWAKDAGYNASYLYNQIIGQSVKYGVKTSKITNLTVNVIKHELDCSILDNQKDAQCKNIVPKFIGLKLTEVQAWEQLNNWVVNVVLIPETDANYDKTKAGLVTSQLEVAYTKLEKLTVTELTVYMMDYPTINLPVTQVLANTQHWTKEQVTTWFTTNMFTLPIFVYDTNFSTTLALDLVDSILVNNLPLTQDTLIRTDAKITFLLSKGIAVNHAPVANNSNPTILLTGGVYTGQASATDADANTTLTYTKLSDPTSGILAFTTNGAYTYTPAVAGQYTFTFSVSDGTLTSNTATITITVN